MDFAKDVFMKDLPPQFGSTVWFCIKGVRSSEEGNMLVSVRG